jgi:Tol biopolymer transport system component
MRFWLLAFLGGGVLVLASAAPAGATFPGRNGQLAGVGETVDGYPAIYAVTPDGLLSRRLVKWGPYFVEGLSYSPNGRRLTFMAFRGGHLSIWTIRADGSRLRRVVENAVVPRSWSKDGRHFLYADQADPNDQADWQVFRSRADGSHVVQLTHFPSGAPTVAGYVPPVMSPDGQHIAFLGITAGFNPDVYISRPDGSGLVRVTTTPRTYDYLLDKAGLGWSPDSSHVVFSAVAFTSYPQTTSWIETARADGSDLQRVVQGVKPTYSPNGLTLVYEGIHPGWFRRNLATGATTPLTLSQGYRADIDTWQPRPGQRRLRLRVWVTDRHHPFDGTAHVATSPAQAGDEIIFHAYRNEDGHWVQLGSPFHAVTNAFGQAHYLALTFKFPGECHVTAKDLGDVDYLPARASTTFPCSSPSP